MPKIKAKIHLEELYENNYLQWLQENIKILEKRELENLDLENLIEELSALARNEKRRVRNLLEQIIRHLLLYQYWEKERAYNSNHWQAEIISFRNQLTDDLTTNLQQHLRENLDSIYQKALQYVEAKTQLKKLPSNCPCKLEQLLDFNWLPEI